MSKKLNLGFTLASTVVLTAACSTGMSVEDVFESTNELNTAFEGLVESSHQLNNLELEMNNQFETVLAEDEDLATIQDESAGVTQNLTEREAVIENMTEQVDLMKDQADALKGYEGTDLPAETVQQVSDDFLAFTQEIETHQDRYIESLNVQRDYLQHIASDEANYEDFASGIDTVNEDYLSQIGRASCRERV